MNNVILKLDRIDKFYRTINSNVHAVKNVSIEILDQDIVALLGSSGCGKTSILRMIAGFEKTSRGKIFIKNRQIHNLPPVHRNVAMAFEGYSLYPTVTIEENIAFALKAAKISQNEIKRRVGELAEMLEIEDILHRLPMSVSGGQQQRASLARALVRDADIYLLDEPMGQLEPQLRTLLRGRIKHYIKQRGQTAILVTHDQTEANALADKIAVMEDGALQQYASADIIKEQPANLFTGTFIGEPPMNVFPAKASIIGDIIHLKLAGETTITYPANGFSIGVRNRLLKTKNIILGIRPHAVKRTSQGVTAKVIANQWLGDQTHIAADFAETTIVLVEHERSTLADGENIAIELNPSYLHIFDSASGMAISHKKEVAK